MMQKNLMNCVPIVARLINCVPILVTTYRVNRFFLQLKDALVSVADFKAVFV